MTTHLIPHAILVTSNKGGVGKTSLAAHLAGYAAAAGWSVLAVDLDTQGNLSRDLGYRSDSDEGVSLTNALLTSNPQLLAPLTVRPGLDVLSGGAGLARAELLLSAERGTNPETARTLGTVLKQLASSYQLVVFDTPPSSTSAIVDGAFACSGSLVIPTRIDDASIDGLEGTAERFAAAKAAHNPMLRALGVVLFAVGTRDTRLIADARTVLTGLLGDAVPLLDATIRASRKAPVDMRAQGLLAPEYETAAEGAESWFEAKRRGAEPPRFSGSASGLAADYQAVVTDLLNRFSQEKAA